MTYDEIQGWFDFSDIYDEAVRRASDGAFLVEIGCWLGKSSAYLHEVAKDSGKDLTLVYVDTWKGELENPAHMQTVADLNGDVYPQWRSNMKDCGADFDGTHPRIVPLRCTSLEAASYFVNATCDFVFIDAAHDYDSVRADITAWLPKLKPCGHIAGHDYGHDPVRRAVDELLTVRTRYSSWERIPLPIQ